jgi:hypothetical protein
LRMKCDGTCAETRLRFSAKRTTPFKSAGTSVQSITGRRGVRINGRNAGYTMFRGSVKGTGYLLHSPVSPSLPLPCLIVCHHISTGLCHMIYIFLFYAQWNLCSLAVDSCTKQFANINLIVLFHHSMHPICRSQWPRGLRRRSAAAVD